MSSRRCCLRCEHELGSAGDPRESSAPCEPGETGEPGAPGGPCDDLGRFPSRARRCPECGLRFDPCDPRTWRRGRRHAFERLVGRCGPVFTLFAVPPVFLFWYAGSVPAGFLASSIVAILLAGSYGVVWLVRLLTRLEIRWRLGGPGPIAAREWHWIAGPTIAVAGVGLAATSLPLRAGLAVARPDLERACEEVRTGTFVGPMSAGWCRIERAKRTWLIVQRRPAADGRTGFAIVNEIDEAELAANPAFAERILAAVADPATRLRPGSIPAEGERVLEAVRFEVAGTGFLDSGSWGWIADGPDLVEGLDQSWRRIAGDWYAMRETW